MSIDYGNARVRALKAGLLAEPDYRKLVTLDLDGMVAALADTPYRPDLQAATPRYRGRRRLDEALRTNLARTLRHLPAWYEGEARAAIALALTRWDVRNVLTILRGSHARSEPTDVRALLVPAGTLDDALLAELAGAPDLRATVEMLVLRGAPTPRIARDVLAAWPAYEASGDVTALELALARSRAEGLGAGLAVAEPVLARVLRAEIDRDNLLIALRLQQLLAAGGGQLGDPSSHLLPGGTLPAALLGRVARTEDAAGAAGLLLQAPLPDAWRDPVARWGQAGVLSALADEIDEAITRFAAGLFTTGDPLSVAIPLAFVWAKENEVRNLRVIGAGLAAATPGDLIERELVILW